MLTVQASGDPLVGLMVSILVIGIVLGCVAAALTLVGTRKAFGDLLGEPVLVVPWAAFAVDGTTSLVAVAVTAGVATCSATRATPVSLAAARE